MIRIAVRDFVVQNYLFGRENGLSDDDSFLERGIIDSTGVLELVSFLEDKFNIKVNNEDLIPDNLDSILKIVNFVNSKVDRPAIEAIDRHGSAGR